MVVMGRYYVKCPECNRKIRVKKNRNGRCKWCRTHVKFLR